MKKNEQEGHTANKGHANTTEIAIKLQQQRTANEEHSKL